MKTTMIFLLTLASQFSYAANYEFECGKTFNIPRLVTIEPKAPGQDGYTLAATYTTRGTDATTGQIKAVEYKLVGQTDVSNELTGKEIPVITLLNLKSPGDQLIIAKTEKVGKTVPAAQISLKNKQFLKLECTLTSFKK